eukprot:NODE_3760_length_1165_cov_130.646833_g3575_i0.p1 GENE.NODE_3760_length_1165_cov_130.646833_g3575_i0~~NODE_3760_length_1165_cov_130.646833_g3575_i0.p1  ORF type:complete len:332 (-),score=118.86 NODE_3760_length_1165_cov_130.646833_g3575_i0:116-1111(-)
MSQRVPFLARSPAGEKLFTAVQKVFTSAKVPVELVKAAHVDASATHVMAGPLPKESVMELAATLSLTTKVTSARAWAPNSLYSGMTTTTFRSLYDQVNPTFTESSSAILPPAVSGDADEAAISDLKRESNRVISGFYNSEASDSLKDTLTLACNTALKGKGDRQVVTVVSKPMGDMNSSPYDDILKVVSKTEADVRAEEFRSANVVIETVPVGSAWPKMVAFPETLGCVVCPPTEAGAQMESLFAGIAGGNGMVAQTLTSSASKGGVFTCANAEDDENPTGAIVASADLLASLGLKAEAERILKAVEKSYSAKDLSGDKMDATVDAICKNL